MQPNQRSLCSLWAIFLTNLITLSSNLISPQNISKTSNLSNSSNNSQNPTSLIFRAEFDQISGQNPKNSNRSSLELFHTFNEFEKLLFTIKIIDVKNKEYQPINYEILRKINFTKILEIDGVEGDLALEFIAQDLPKITTIEKIPQPTLGSFSENEKSKFQRDEKSADYDKRPKSKIDPSIEIIGPEPNYQTDPLSFLLPIHEIKGNKVVERSEADFYDQDQYFTDDVDKKITLPYQNIGATQIPLAKNKNKKIEEDLMLPKLDLEENETDEKTTIAAKIEENEKGVVVKIVENMKQSPSNKKPKKPRRKKPKKPRKKNRRKNKKPKKERKKSIYNPTGKKSKSADKTITLFPCPFYNRNNDKTLTDSDPNFCQNWYQKYTNTSSIGKEANFCQAAFRCFTTERKYFSHRVKCQETCQKVRTEFYRGYSPGTKYLTTVAPPLAELVDHQIEKLGDFGKNITKIKSTLPNKPSYKPIIISKYQRREKPFKCSSVFKINLLKGYYSRQMRETNKIARYQAFLMSHKDHGVCNRIPTKRQRKRMVSKRRERMRMRGRGGKND